MNAERPTHLSDELRQKAQQALKTRAKDKRLQFGALQSDQIPSSGETVYRLDAYPSGEPNSRRYTLVMNERGEEVDLAALSKREGKTFFAEPAVSPGALRPVASPAASITIDPTENDLVLNPGEGFEEEITVKIPGNAGVTKADVYFLADTTGSMSSILAAVQAGANNILTALNGLGIDLAYGVGNYQDFPDTNPAFAHQLNPTATAADVTNAINAWAAGAGGDTPEGQLFALDQLAQAPGGSIGWRSGAKRIILWFGDAPGHDPVCAAISGLGYDITEATATTKLVNENITVLAISTDTGVSGALDGDPTMGNDYSGACGAPGGSAGQAKRITAATGGVHVSGINAGNIVNTITDLISTAATSINSVKLVATGGTAPFVVSITPPEYGPLSGDDDHTLTFKVEFKGVEACKDEDQVFTGALEVIADGAVVARKRVRITVPACKPREVYSYSVKFICGEQAGCDCQCSPGVRPGAYATEINIHNYSGENAPIRKYVLPLVFAGAPQGREPRHVTAKAVDRIVLPPNSATMDDCCRLAELLFDGAPPARSALNIGILEIVSTVELNVTAVYTVSHPETGAVSIDVEQIRGQIKPLARVERIPPKFTAVKKA